MNGVVILVGLLLAAVILALFLEKNWFGLLLCVFALFLVFGTGRHT